MIIVFLILLLMNPCWAIDDYDADLQAAIEASLRESQPQSQVGSDRYPLSTSAFPSGWGARSAPKVSQNYTIQNIFDKVLGADTESEYWQGLETAAPAIKLAGYMDFLDRKKDPKFDRLFKSLDASEWAILYGKLKPGKRTANNVFLLLDEVKGAFYSAFIRADSKAKYNLSINDAMLSLISGKWGFSKCHDARTMGQLKDAAKRIGRTECEEDNNLNQFAAKIFGVLKEKSSSGVTDQDYKRHRLSAFSYMANGYWDGAGKKTDDLTGLVSAATPKFQAADLKGHPLEDFIKNPAETLKKPLVVRSPETAFTKFISGSTPPKGFQGFLKDFDPNDVNYSDNQENLAALQGGFQGKTRQQAEKIVDELMKEGFLKKPEDENDQLSLKSILIESGQYQGANIDGAYQDCFPKEKVPSKSILNAGLESWVSNYIQNIYKKFYAKREAFVVIYEGYIGRKFAAGGSEVTKLESEIAGDQTALKAMADDLKARYFPNNVAGQEVVLELGAPSVARLCLYEEEIKVKGLVTQKRKLLRTIPINEFEVALIRASANRLNADPNAQPAAVEKKDVKLDRPDNLSYAVFDGPRVTQDQKIQAWGRAIDYLIQQKKIDRSLKLPVLLYCLRYF